MCYMLAYGAMDAVSVKSSYGIMFLELICFPSSKPPCFFRLRSRYSDTAKTRTHPDVAKL